MTSRSIVFNENAFGAKHVALWGRGRSHYVAHFRAPVSVKSVLKGTAVWRTDEGVHQLAPGSCLVLNDEHTYTVEIENTEPVETFCIFFRKGFIEDIARARTTSHEALLESDLTGNYSFLEASHRDEAIEFRLRRLHGLLRRAADSVELGAATLDLGEQIVRGDEGLQRLATRVPAARPSTREELLRRLLRARDFIETSLTLSLTLEEVARHAALSPYHLHRSFRRTFGEPMHRFITRRRLERAAALLRTTAMTVTEICNAVGFESATSFATLFRHHYGASPRDFGVRRPCRRFLVNQ